MVSKEAGHRFVAKDSEKDHFHGIDFGNCSIRLRFEYQTIEDYEYTFPDEKFEEKCCDAPPLGNTSLEASA
ncbi:hypothetical protein TNCV_1540371 [Trichonephila clavipes]|nr:hypothetical protein TNCV_1540371 [Trichonephila clavipes]